MVLLPERSSLDSRNICGEGCPFRQGLSVRHTYKVLENVEEFEGFEESLTSS